MRPGRSTKGSRNLWLTIRAARGSIGPDQFRRAPHDGRYASFSIPIRRIVASTIDGIIHVYRRSNTVLIPKIEPDPTLGTANCTSGILRTKELGNNGLQGVPPKHPIDQRSLPLAKIKLSLLAGDKKEEIKLTYHFTDSKLVPEKQSPGRIVVPASVTGFSQERQKIAR